MVDVSVIIVNMNTRELLRECLESVRRSSVTKEVIVVDNASTDGSPEMVAQQFPEVILKRNATNERFAKPNNDAMKIAGGRYLFLLNSDAAVRPEALERLLKFMDSHPNVGMSGPQLLFPDGRIQPSCRGFVSLWTHCCDMFLLDRMFPLSTFFAGSEMTFFDHREQREVDHVMAAAVLVRSEAVQSVGMLDEKFSIYYNDLDWSYRMAASGWKTVFFPSAQVIHHLGSTARPLIKDENIFLEQYENIVYFYQKHFGGWAVVAYKILLAIGFVPRTVYWFLRSIVNRSETVQQRLDFSVRSLMFAISS